MCYTTAMRPSGQKSTVRRLAFAILPVAAIVAMIGFWRLAPGPTFVIAALAVVVMLAALWAAGKED